MKKVEAAQTTNGLDALIDAAQREPVVIQREGRDIAVIVSMAMFDASRAANIEAYLETSHGIAAEARANGLTAETLASLLPDED